MAVLTVLAPPTKPLVLAPSPSLIPISHFLNITDSTTNSCCSHRTISKCTSFSTISAVSHLITKSAKLKLHSIQPRMMPGSSTSPGSGFSWLKNNSSVENTINGHVKSEGPLHSFLPTKPAEVSSVQDLFEFICSGPLIDKLGLTSEKVSESIDKWVLCGSHLCRLFQLNELFLTEPQKVRIYHYYIPVFLWCEQEISDHNSKFKDEEDVPPLVIGFSAPQGCGKTTLVFALDFLFRTTGRKTATISIDDFYLTAEDQAKLRESNPGNALLEYRGNAGSHDLPLSIETLTALNKLTKEGTKMNLPRYNKSAYNGRGDRADPSTWPEVEGPLTEANELIPYALEIGSWGLSYPGRGTGTGAWIDLWPAVLFEGWMLGFKPVSVEVVKAVDPQLEIINKNLEAYYDAWDKFIKSWIVIRIQDPSYVYQWRLQAEIAMRADGKPGMSDEEVLDFVSRYLPAYKAYLPTLYAEGPNGSDPNHLLVVGIDEGRNPILGN
ncbi:d-glycerate 3-kinase chloroplastic [Phtheirospermum japonicum]|uniref:D-glycerate 3-kinase chloroplastic n=1 Tax=Phtheirospermum japonicum TaxID=374723 RepID=A0A830D1W2_9LAMI|nr:d-glycerate 3-kinase chloroplastic [Phtheirospermum japonicum]